MIERHKGDPLQWWKQNEGRFKLLAKEARKCLCSPPSVPSERVFSEVSAIYDKRRSKLTGEHADQLCFLHYNLVLLDWDYYLLPILLAYKTSGSHYIYFPLFVHLLLVYFKFYKMFTEYFWVIPALMLLILLI